MRSLELAIACTHMQFTPPQTQASLRLTSHQPIEGIEYLSHLSFSQDCKTNLQQSAQLIGLHILLVWGVYDRAFGKEKRLMALKLVQCFGVFGA